MHNFLYLSPHFDDVALSCGGMVLHNTRRQQAATVLTICAGAPDRANLSPFARRQHTQWGFTSPSAREPRDPIAVRRAEDALACARLGAEAAYLAVPDVIYRRDGRGRPVVFSDHSLFGRVHPDERPLIRRIAREIVAHVGRKSITTIVAPLAVGRHVDHQLVRDAARLLLIERYHIVWYEDFPYAEKRGAVTRARKAFGAGEWQCAVFPIDVRAKIKAIGAYRSQLKNTFADRSDMAARVRAYNATVAEADGHAERFWHLKNDALRPG